MALAALVAVASVPVSAQRPTATRQAFLRATTDSQPAARGTPQDAPPQGGAPQQRTGTYMNVGFSGLMDFGWSSEPNVRALQRGDHDPAVRGFTVPNEELTLDGAVEPYFKGFVNVVYKIDDQGESAFELE